MKSRNFLMYLMASWIFSLLTIQSISARNNPPERLFVFTDGPQGHLWYKTFDGANWGQWESLGGIIKGGPDACSPNPGEVIVFARGLSGPSDSELFYQTLRLGGVHTESNWLSFHTKVGSDPGAICRSGGKVDVFFRLFSNPATSHAWYENGVWANQYKIDRSLGSKDNRRGIGGENLGGAMLGSPDACSWGGQRLDLFVRGTDEYIWHKFRDDKGVWHEWESIGGLKMTSDPSAVARANGQMSVFARGENNQIWTKTYTLDNDRWGPWLPLGGMVLAGGPDATRTADNRIDVFARGVDHAIWHTSVIYQGNIPDIKKVPAWESLGGYTEADPSAVGVNW